MIKLVKEELRNLSLFLRENLNEIIVICVAVLLLVLHEYHPLNSRWLSALVYLAVLPVLFIVLIQRKNPLDFGLRPGNVKIWGLYVVITCVISIPVLYLASGNSTMAQYYSRPQFDLLLYSLETIVYLFSWEFIFRGFLLFGLKDKLNESSILIQMIPFVLLHFGKPEIETISTIITGIYFGYIAYRGNSYWPAFIIHLFINVVFLIFVNIL